MDGTCWNQFENLERVESDQFHRFPNGSSGVDYKRIYGHRLFSPQMLDSTLSRVHRSPLVYSQVGA